jgi:hypothetical protein
VASPVNKSTASRRDFWVSIARIFLVEVLVLIALSGAVVGYLNWSSEVAFSEFLAASREAAGVKPAVQAIRERMPCDRGAPARRHGSG